MTTDQRQTTLIQSSPTTRAWVANLRKLLTWCEYSEVKYWASFRNRITGRTVARLNPQKEAIRLFVSVSPSEDPDVTGTPATRGWEDAHPSLFMIRSERDLAKAKTLIERSDQPAPRGQSCFARKTASPPDAG
jgi:hypothetical protein